MSYDLYFWRVTRLPVDPADLANALADGDASALDPDPSVLAFHQAVRTALPDVGDGMIEPDPGDPQASRYAIVTLPMGAVGKYVSAVIQLALDRDLTIYDPQVDELVKEVPPAAEGQTDAEPVNVVPMPGATSTPCPRCRSEVELPSATDSLGGVPMLLTRCQACGAGLRVLLPPRRG